eukprot:CAMPEP_0183740200 /NCGR_PEP_ID=MMETSP0737-20130205/58989_1 /TAXON_ID=385413 /ORGANISM="Thalassiosira miniscula, Strain CCMP1093" /LENGTH=256 /DNA_ID=CAMNT_0025975197 /DNA_START=520 /DNA_END=1290 /DNA_ORIENTATION=-
MSSTKENGFHPLYVYSKAVPKSLEQYSNEGEDKLILALMKANDEKKSKDKKNKSTDEEQQRPPYFVDLGASDPLVSSNTFQLEQNGWEGLCIEPNPQYWYRLASFRTCTIIAAYIGGPPGENGKGVPVRSSNGEGGGIVGSGMDNEGGVEEHRNRISIRTIMEQTKVPKEIDYVSLDIEGGEASVLTHFPWESHFIKFMTIHRPKEGLTTLLQSHGYKMVMKISSHDETLWIYEEKVSLSVEEIVQVAATAGVKPV